MSDGITITVAAETADAAKRLEELARSGDAVGKSMVGMSYYFRSAMDGVRLALAGGGTRAGFYALDEAMRGLIASGNLMRVAMLALSPAVGAAAVAAGGLTAAWIAEKNAASEAIKTHNELTDRLKKLPEVIKNVNDAAKEGLISPDLQQSLLAQIGAVRPGQKPGGGSIDLTSYFQQGLAKAQGLATQAPAFLPSQFGLPSEHDMAAVNEQLEKAGILVSKIDEKTGQYSYEPSDKGKALMEIIELRNRLNTETLSDFDKERAAAKQTYDEQLAGLNELIERSGKLLKDGQAEQMRTQLKAGYDNTITGINFKQQSENEQKAQEAYAKGQEQFAKMVETENKELDDKLNLQAAQAGKTREEIYQQEFAARMFLLTQQLYSGEISEQEYTKAVEEEQAKRLDAARKAAEEQKRIDRERLQTLQETVRMNREIAASNPFLTQAQRLKQEMPSLMKEAVMIQEQINAQRNIANSSSSNERQKVQANHEIASLMLQQVGLVNQMVQASHPWISAWSQVVDKLEQMHNLAQTTARTFSDVFNEAISSISQNFTKLIEGTESWGQAIRNIGTSILNELIGAVVKLAVQTIASMVATAIFGEALADTASAAYSAAWAAPAILASIASYGGAAAAAPGEVMAAMAFAPAISAVAVGSRERGGDVKAGMPYIVGERRPELFVPDHSGTIVPRVPSATDLGGGSGTSGAAASHQTNLGLAIFNTQADAQRWAESEPGEQWFLDMSKKHAFKYQQQS